MKTFIYDYTQKHLRPSPISLDWFALFRLVFGVYLAFHFAALLPYAAATFSSAGQMGEASLNFTYGLFPNLLYQFDSPFAVTAFVGAQVLFAALFACGYRRRLMALLLWYGWAALFNRNNLISNPGLPYVGFLLLATALVPAGEGLAFFRGRTGDRAESRDDRASTGDWSFPPILHYGIWALLAAGYSISGFQKMLAPSWQNGEALRLVLELPLARDTALNSMLLAMPDIVLQLMTWSVLLLETGFLFFCLHGAGRKWAFLGICGMHAGIMLTVDFVDLTLGMLMVHMLLFDPRWIRSGIRMHLAGLAIRIHGFLPRGLAHDLTANILLALIHRRC